MENDYVVYKILVQRHLNDDRLLNERGTIFILSSTVLFAGFAVLTEFPAFALLIVICILGVVLSVLAIRGNYRTSKGLDFWDEKEHQIEDESLEEPFVHMRTLRMMPTKVQERTGGCLKNRHIYTWCIPTVFIILWVGSFIWVLLQST